MSSILRINNIKIWGLHGDVFKFEKTRLRKIGQKIGWSYGGLDMEFLEIGAASSIVSSALFW